MPVVIRSHYSFNPLAPASFVSVLDHPVSCMVVAEVCEAQRWEISHPGGVGQVSADAEEPARRAALHVYRRCMHITPRYTALFVTAQRSIDNRTELNSELNGSSTFSTWRRQRLFSHVRRRVWEFELFLLLPQGSPRGLAQNR